MAEGLGQVWVELKVDGKALKKELSDMEKRIAESKKKQETQERKEKEKKPQKQESPSGIKGEEPSKKLSQLTRKEGTKVSKAGASTTQVAAINAVSRFAPRFPGMGMIGRAGGVVGAAAGGFALGSLIAQQIQAFMKSALSDLVPDWLLSAEFQENYERGVDELWNAIHTLKANLASMGAAFGDTKTMVTGLARTADSIPTASDAMSMYKNFWAVRTQEQELKDWFERKRTEDVAVGIYNGIMKQMTGNTEGK